VGARYVGDVRAIRAGVLDSYSYLLKALDGRLPYANMNDLVMVKCGQNQSKVCMFPKGR
jgi:hypothetical protein